MKESLKHAKAFGMELLLFVGGWVLVFLFLLGLVKYSQWQEDRRSNHQIAHQELSVYMSADGGYYAKMEATSHAYGNGDTITTKSLRFIPAHTNSFFADSSGFEDIMVWDYENDGKWDKIFLTAYPTRSYGANAIILPDGIQNWSNWTFEPCRADQNYKQPFTSATVAHVVELIQQFPE
jgi:hypothetical protein